MSYVIIFVLSVALAVLWSRMRQLDENVATIHGEYLGAHERANGLAEEVAHKDKQINGILRDIRELRLTLKKNADKSIDTLRASTGKIQEKLDETKDLLRVSKEANKIRLDELDRISDLWCSTGVAGSMREHDIAGLSNFCGSQMARVMKRIEEITFTPGNEEELTEKEKTVRVNRMYNVGMHLFEHFITNKAIFEEALTEITDTALNFHKALTLHRQGKGELPVATVSKDWEVGTFLIPQFEAILIKSKIEITPDIQVLIKTYIGILVEHVAGIVNQLNEKNVHDNILLTGFFSISSTDDKGKLLHRLILPLYGMEYNEHKRTKEASKLLKF